MNIDHQTGNCKQGGQSPRFARRPNLKEFWAKKSVGDSEFWEKKIFNQNHMKYILYARKSTEEDDRQILSIEAKVFELKEFAAKEKLEIVASFQEAKTAKEPGRIKFAEILSLIEKGKAGGILSWNPDCLARNSVDGGKIIHMNDRGLIKALKFPTFWFEPTPQGLFMLQIAFGQSKYYVDLWGVGPQTDPCHGSVLPLYYRPIIIDFLC